MGKDDYEVIVCKALVYVYRMLKGKLSEENLEYYLYPMTKQHPISQEYLDAVLLVLTWDENGV